MNTALTNSGVGGTMVTRLTYCGWVSSTGIENTATYTDGLTGFCNNADVLASRTKVL